MFGQTVSITYDTGSGEGSMPDSNSKKICTDLFNQWAVSTACLQNDIRQSQEFIELQRLFWECAYEACFEEQGGGSRNGGTGIYPN